MSDLGSDAPKHHPTYYRLRDRCWAKCACGWVTDPHLYGNQPWAQREFAKHLTEAKR